jgi:multidrug efflux pump subunit AcrA (membrane-fusion protein)
MKRATGSGVRGVRADTHVRTGGTSMQGSRRWIVPVLLVGGLALGACGKAREAAPADPPAKVEQIVVAGSKHQGVRLTDQAPKRLDVQTAPVAAGAGGRLVIPAAAVEYNNDGSTFVYTNPESLAYVQQAITVDSINADQAVLSAGPAAGTRVVTVGAAELLGVEVSQFEE